MKMKYCVCIYCGEYVKYDQDNPEFIAQTHKKMTDHDRVCLKNPLVDELHRLKADLASTEAVNANLRARIAALEADLRYWHQECKDKEKEIHRLQQRVVHAESDVRLYPSSHPKTKGQE